MFNYPFFTQCVLVVTVFLALTLTASTRAENACEMDNRALQAMRDGIVTIASPSGRQVQLKVKIADNNYTRGQGFQRVCAEQIAAMPILFLFGMEVLPSFHMHNVIAPIDIAFIDAHGSIDSMYKMRPYGPTDGAPRYTPKAPIVAALEVSPAFFEQNAIGPDSIITWIPLAKTADAP